MNTHYTTSTLDVYHTINNMLITSCLICFTHVCLSFVLNRSSCSHYTSFQIEEIRSLEETFDVKVVIDKPRAVIRFQGRTEDTSQAKANISNIFRRVEVAEVKKSHASVIAAMVQTFGIVCVCMCACNVH